MIANINACMYVLYYTLCNAPFITVVSCIFNKTIRAVNVARHYTVSENHR